MIEITIHLSEEDAGSISNTIGRRSASTATNLAKRIEEILVERAQAIRGSDRTMRVYRNATKRGIPGPRAGELAARAMIADVKAR